MLRAARGVYCLPDTWEDEFLIASLRFPRGVLSHGTALFLHDLTDRTPELITMTFPRRYNATSARAYGIRVASCAADIHQLGVVDVETPAGGSVRAYDVERTLCDLMRGHAFLDTQIVNPAMRAYVASRGRDIRKLMDYAAMLRVESKMRAYLEVLL